MQKLCTALVLAIIPVLALGSTVVGNPGSSIVRIAGAPVYVQSIVAYKCSTGQQAIWINTVVDTSPEAFTFQETEFCSIDLRVKWKPGAALETIPVDGFDMLKITSEGMTVAIEIDASTHTASLN